MNNFEKIKSMDIDEMAKCFTQTTATYCEYCVFKEKCEPQGIYCKDFIKQWLESEVRE